MAGFAKALINWTAFLPSPYALDIVQSNPSGDAARAAATGDTMTQPDIALIAHLMRRAGFGATREELDEYASKGATRPRSKTCSTRRIPSGSATIW